MVSSLSLASSVLCFGALELSKTIFFLSEGDARQHLRNNGDLVSERILKKFLVLRPRGCKGESRADSLSTPFTLPDATISFARSLPLHMTLIPAEKRGTVLTPDPSRLRYLVRSFISIPDCRRESFTEVVRQ